MALSTKDPSEGITIEFDFSGLTATTPTSATTTATPYQGTDTTPIVMGSVSIVGTKVYQPLTGGTDGMIYDLVCTGVVSGSNLVVAGVLAVRKQP